MADARECWVDPDYQCEAPVNPSAASEAGPFADYDWSPVLEACAAAPAGAPAAGAPAVAGQERSGWEQQLQQADARTNLMGDCKGLRERCRRLTETGMVAKRHVVAVGSE